MARRAFYSFHFDADNWRAAQVRNCKAIDGNEPVSDNSWEQVKRGGDAAIQRWIDNELSGRSCTVVLIGAATAGRKWIEYEIQKSWNDRKGLVGVYINKLKDRNGYQSARGSNPFNGFTFKQNGMTYQLSDIVQAYEPPYFDSKDVYGYISENLASWVEEAVTIRNRY